MCINFVDMLCFIIMECKMLIIILIFELLKSNDNDTSM